MYRGPCLPDIAEAEEEPAEDSLSSASTASFWSHERELYDPWWRSTPPTADAIRASSSTPPLYRGLIRTTAPPTSPVRSRPRRSTKPSTSGRSTTPPAYSYNPPRRRTSYYGGGGDGRDSSSGGGSGGTAPSANGHSAQQPQQQQQPKQDNSAANKRTPTQKDAYWFAQGDNTPPPKQQRASLAGPNDLFFGEDDKSSGLSYKDREERLRQLRDKQQYEKHQKLEELKEQAAAAQRFREQQENERRRRLDEIRIRDADRRTQVEERKRIIQQAEQDRREAVLRKNARRSQDFGKGGAQIFQEREQRMESKRRNEKSNIVFAFGSSTPRMLDPKDNSSNTSYFGSRRATSTTNVHLVETSISRRASECSDMDLSRKRATSAHSLDRKTDGEDLMTRSMTAAIPATAARRRTDLLPAMPSLRDSPGSSRSSPRHRSPGMRSGTVTPNSPSRPTSALSQGSNNSSQVSLRSRTSPRKPRPLSIAGSSLSSADKPRDSASATLSRESRPMERKLSVGSAPSSKPARAKSAGSDRSAPATPARTTAKASTPKKTPSQVKAESAAKKAVEKSKTTPKVKSQKITPLQSPSVENKPLPGATKEKRVTPPKEEKSIEPQKPKEETPKKEAREETPKKETREETPKKEAREESPQKELETDSVDIVPVLTPVPEANGDSQPEINKPVEPQPTKEQQQKQPETEALLLQVKSENEERVSSVPTTDEQDEQEKTPQKAADKPVTGYASEEEYKAAIAEKRRLAREAKEREQELERQKQLAEEERERKEEEDFLKMMEQQKKAEEERLRKAIEEADKNREEEAKKKEEEEKQREEAERIEQQKRIETEERLAREEEERQARKSRVAAIMARTRGKGGSNTPTKSESKTPSEENKGFEIDMNASMTDSMINNLEAVVESQQSVQPKAKTDTVDSEASSQQQQSEGASQPSSGFSTEPVSDVSSKSSQPASQVESTVALSPPDVASSTKVEQTISNTEASENTLIDNVISGITSVKLEEPHVNGDSPVPMDTTPTQSVDLLGNITGSDVNTRNHNGVDTTPAQTSQGTDNLGSLDPLNSTHNTTSITPAASNFEQIIDLGQIKLSNEDAVNSNPPSPFIAFEQNLNKKQSQENTTTVPDLLL